MWHTALFNYLGLDRFQWPEYSCWSSGAGLFNISKLVIELGAIGIHKSARRWISEWLSCRTLWSLWTAQSPHYTKSLWGSTGQRARSSPFLIYINEMSSCVNFCNIKLFADDSLSYHRIVSGRFRRLPIWPRQPFSVGGYLANEFNCLNLNTLELRGYLKTSCLQAIPLITALYLKYLL